MQCDGTFLREMGGNSITVIHAILGHVAEEQITKATAGERRPPPPGIQMIVHDRYRQAQSRSVKQKSKRKLFSDMSWAPYAAVEADTENAKPFHCTKVL